MREGLRFAVAVLLAWALWLWVTTGAQTECAGQILARGVLDGALHELEDGYATVGSLTVAVPPRSVTADVLRVWRGRRVEIVIRETAPLQPERLKRK